MRPRQPLRVGPGRVAGLGATVFAGLVMSGAALAAPFCLQNQGMTPQCIYYDPAICQRDAQKQNAECGVNPRESKPMNGSGQYCLVMSGGISFCEYQDYDSCQAEARRRNAACTGAPTRNPSRPPDPYSRQGY